MGHRWECFVGERCKGGSGERLDDPDHYEQYWTMCERCAGIYRNSHTITAVLGVVLPPFDDGSENEEWVGGLLTCVECFQRMNEEE
jgi:hypothetical protein